MEDSSFQKVLSPLEAWSFSYGCLLGWGAFAMPLTVFLPQSGLAGSLTGLAVGAVFITVIALNYHYLTMQCEDTGGIFSLLYHSMGLSHAFAASWGISFAHLLIIPLNARALANLSHALLLEYAGIEPSLRILGLRVPLVDLAVIVAAMVCGARINSRGIKTAARVQTVCALILAGGIALMFGMMLFSGVDVRAGLTSSRAPGAGPLRSFMLTFIMVPWAFVGFDSLSALSNETSFSKKKLGRLMVLAVAVGAFGYMAGVVITALGAPTDWLSGVSHPGTGLDGIAVLASLRRRFGAPGMLIALVTLLCGIATGIIGSIANVSRLYHTMECKGCLFSSLSRKNDRNVPFRSVRFAVVCSIVLVLLSDTFNTMEMVASICTAFGYGYCSCGAMRAAAKQRDSVHTALGAVGLAVCALWLVFLTVPILGTVELTDWRMYSSLAAWVFFGIAGYIVTRRDFDEVLNN